MAAPTTPTAVTGPYTPPAATPTDGVKKQTEIFSSEGFLQLLASQVRAQNPLEPMKDTEFVAQMAQFSQLEQTTALAKNIEALTLSGQLAQGASLIGRTVTYQPADGSAPVTGVVGSLTIGGDGRSMSLIVNGVAVDAKLVTGVSA
jgi:flagellar basal-body rod modification protein FlgD